MDQPQIYPCFFYEFSRSAAVALTQSKRARRTLANMKNIEKLSKKNYTSILNALNKTTNNAKTCNGEKIDTTSKDNFKTLTENCSATNIMVACNPALVPLFNSSTKAFFGSCVTKLEAFNDQYKVCPAYDLIE